MWFPDAGEVFEALRRLAGHGWTSGADYATVSEHLIDEMVDRGILFDDAVGEFERAFICARSPVRNGSLTNTSNTLGMHRNTLTRKIDDLPAQTRPGRAGGPRSRPSPIATGHWSPTVPLALPVVTMTERRRHTHLARRSLTCSFRVPASRRCRYHPPSHHRRSDEA